MKNKDKNKKNRYVSSFENAVDISDAASAQECTGLIPSMPHSEAENDSYDKIVKYKNHYRGNF